MSAHRKAPVSRGLSEHETNLVLATRKDSQ